MGNNDTEKTHESYGMVGINKAQSSGTTLFGSSIFHREMITLTIRRATVSREQNVDRYYADEPLIEVRLSPSQFAELITSPNQGFGVPCTITHINKTPVEPPPPLKKKTDEMHEEFQKKLENISAGATLYMEEALDILANKPSISKKDREVIVDAFKMYRQEIVDNLPYMETMFGEQISQAVTEAKAEIEAFVENKIRSTGLESMKNHMPLLGE